MRKSLAVFAVCLSIVFAASAQDATNQPSAQSLGIEFQNDSTSRVIVERNGHRYLVDLYTQTITPVEAAAPSASTSKPAAVPAPSAESKPVYNVYKPGDDQLFSLPTGRPLPRRGFTVNFTHRFAYSSAFHGRARGATLGGLDDIAVSSFGFRYGITDRLYVMAYRAPSFIGRQIELLASFTFLNEAKGAPLNAAMRFSVDGSDDFSRDYTTNFEWIFSRSIKTRAQFYLVPTLSIHNRPLTGIAGGPETPPPFQPCQMPTANGLFGQFNAKSCANSFALGSGIAVDVRPTLAIIAEAHPVLVNGPELGIHRAAFAFGIQKKIFGHAFTFGFTNSPGTTVSQRIGTRATFLAQPGADTPARMFIGFDLTRQLRF